MKQKLFALVSMAALIASCTNDDFLENSQIQQNPALSEGIVFKMADAVTTRGDFKTDAEGAFYTAWNAEVDRIGVIYSGVAKGIATSISGVTADAWNDQASADRTGNVGSEVELGTGDPGSIAVYKTTRSGGQGYFTAVSDDDILKFAEKAARPQDQVKGSFRIFRPVYDASGDQISVEYTREEDVETMIAHVNDFTTQTQKTGKAEFDNFFMVSDPIDDAYSEENAVGESLELNFARPFAALAICTEGYDEEVYGKLTKVTVTMDESNIASDDATVDIAKKDKDGNWTIDEGTGQKSVELTIGDGSGLEWSDDYYAFIQILPVDRSTYKASEDYEVKLTFGNGDVTVKKSTTNNWTANSFVKITANLNEQPYLYLGTVTKTLIINSAMPTLDASNEFDGVAASDVQSFVSHIALSAKDLKTLNDKFTNVSDLTLANQAADLGENLSAIKGLSTKLATLTLSEATTAPVITDATTWSSLTTLNLPKVTTVPDEAFNGNTVLTKVNMPLVQTIGNNAFDGATNLTTIGCNNEAIIIGTTNATTQAKTSALTSVGSFAFANIDDIATIDAPALATIGARAFGTSALNSLTSVLLPKYDFADTYNAIALLGGSELKTVDLSSVSELSLTTISFAGNEKLETVTLKEGAKIGTSAFMGCKKLVTVKNLNKVAEIGEKAFNGTALTEAELHVATIGKEAFKGCTSLATVTLGAEVKTIGEGAFQGATTLNVINNLALIETIGKNAFNGCTEVSTFDYTNAALGEGAFQGCTGLKGQVRSNVTTLEKNVFNGASSVSTFVFPNVTTINEGALQGLMITSPYATITFGAELASIDAKAFVNATIGGGDGSTAAKAKTATVNYNIVLTGDQNNLTVKNSTITYKATDGKYYAITFNSVM